MTKDDVTDAEISERIQTERRATIALLETLEPQEWATPSLCTAWTVQDVAAHLAWAPVTGPGEALPALARAGFRMNRFIADSAVRWAARGPQMILEQLRENAARDVKPMGMPRVAALYDAIVHGLDIRRPLGRPRPVPPEAFVRMADWHVGLRWPTTVPVGGSLRRRLGEVRLVADDADWSWGDGPELRGSSTAVLLLLAARPVEPGELTGPGAVGRR